MSHNEKRRDQNEYGQRILREALELYDLDFNVVPIWKGTKRLGLKAGALTREWQFDERPPVKKVQRWFSSRALIGRDEGNTWRDAVY
jgi:hypothetical protein